MKFEVEKETHDAAVLGIVVPCRVVDRVPSFVFFENDPAEFALLGRETSIHAGDLAFGLVATFLFFIRTRSWRGGGGRGGSATR